MSCKCVSRRCGGFSLIEIMVVIVLIGLLAGVVTIATRSYLVQGRRTRAKADMTAITTAIGVYYGTYGNYPTNEQGLEALLKKTTTHPDGLLNRQSVPLDPWGREYQYNRPGRDQQPYEVICFGADGQEGGEGEDADMISWQLEQP